jgi:hypothetical protein
MELNKMKTQEDKNAQAREQAKAQLETLIEMVDRLDHCQNCTDSDCMEQGEEQDRDDYHDEDKARQIIEEDPLSVEIRSGWYTPGETPEPAEFMILLCTGGPACRICGELDEHKQPDRAWIEFQDWFTSWEQLITNHEESQAILTYCQQFYFGE